MLIPVSALDNSVPEQFSVWIYRPEGSVVEKVPVQVGSISEQQVQILAGLNRGDFVVSAGIYHLQQGQQVRPFDKY
ncbi:hypothetical protein [Alishewanella longhuensis]